IALPRAPARLAEAALVIGCDLAVGGQRSRHLDPIVGIEIVGAVHDQDGRAAGHGGRAEHTVEQRDIARAYAAGAVVGHRLSSQVAALTRASGGGRSAITMIGFSSSASRKGS